METVLLSDLLPEVLLACGDFAACADRGVYRCKVAHIHPEKSLGQATVSVVGCRCRGGRWLGLRFGRSGWRGLGRILSISNRFLKRLEAREFIVFSPVQIILAVFSSERLVHGITSHVVMHNCDSADTEHGAHKSVTNTAELLAVVRDLTGARKRNVLKSHLIAWVDLSTLGCNDAFSVIDHVETDAAGRPAQAGVPEHEDLNAEEDSEQYVSVVGLKVDEADRTLHSLLRSSHVIVSECSEVRHDRRVERSFVS